MTKTAGPIGAFPFAFVTGVLLLISGSGLAQDAGVQLSIENIMTAQELKDTGVSTLTQPQRKALDAWLNRYTEFVIKIAASNMQTPQPPPSTQPARPTSGSGGSPCSPAIESTISGDFEGWEGETLFKLDNGQIWEQAEYDYMYSYQYRPDVTIYEAAAGCRMKVEDEGDTILVKRIR